MAATGRTFLHGGCSNCLEHPESIGSSVCFTFFEILLVLSHCIGNMCKAEDLGARSARKGVEGCGLHFDCQYLF